MKLNKKVKAFIAIIALFYCVTLIQSTYAKYVSGLDANTNLAIARWKIMLNDVDITTESSFTGEISPVLNGSNYVNEGVIAPAASGYFDIVIDGSESDVSFQYNLTVTQADDNTVSDLRVTSYQIGEGEVEDYEGTISNIINSSDTNKSRTVHFFVDWYDGENEEMDNEDDTAATVDGVASFKVNVNVVQVAS